MVLDPESGESRICNLIVANQELPCQYSKKFFTPYDQQKMVLLTCMENSHSSGPEDGTIDMKFASAEVGSAQLKFDKALPKESPIEITFTMTPDGLLTMYGKDLTTQREVKAQLKTEAILDPEELERNRARNTALTVS